jgi:hypothetical protein
MSVRGKVVGFITWRAAVMKLRRRILRGEYTSTVLVILIMVGLMALLPAPEARACWISLERQCFSTTTGVDSVNRPWPWQHPTGSGRYWRRAPNPPNATWGIQNVVYDDHLCIDDTRALWCAGYPPSNDPRYNNYPRNYGSYVTYGPLDMTYAVAAEASFWLWDRTEANHDSIFWGVATTSNIQTMDQINFAGSHSDNMIGSEFQPETIDFAHLINGATQAEVSMIGQTGLYLFWYFISDNNATQYVGSFVDNVQMIYDDGGVDLMANSIALVRQDSASLNHPAEGDTAMAVFHWTTCSGGIGTYPPFHVMGVYDNSTVVLDTLISEVLEGQSYTLYSRPWIFGPDSHRVRFTLDTLNEVAETNEDNNVKTTGWFIMARNRAPHFRWLFPSDTGGTVVADTGLWLKWVCWDSLETSTVMAYSGTDSFNCSGLMLQGGSRDYPISMTEPAPDSLFWSVRGQQNNRILYPFVHVLDTENDTCVYAPHNIRVQHTGAVDPEHAGLIPDKFFLTQNFPNPFNPTTELTYGLHSYGRVRLAVYDLLGREVAMLVNSEQTPGSYRVSFDGAHLPTGIYLYSLTTPEGTLSRKMMLLK